MNVKTTLRVAAVVLSFGTAFVPTVAYAGSHGVTPGGTCTKQGAIGYHHSDRYQCRLVKPGCLVWKFAGHPTGQWTGGPAQCSACSSSPTATASPTGSPSPTPSITPSGSTAASPSTSAAGGDVTVSPTVTGPSDTLPVTGPKQDVANAAVKAGGLSLLIGLALYGLSFLRRRRTT